MEYIKEVLGNKEQTIDNLIACVEKIKENGNVVVIKFDGERLENGYTIFISFPNNEREMIRTDQSDLKIALIEILKQYFLNC